jgi:hypothetical protein
MFGEEGTTEVSAQRCETDRSIAIVVDDKADRMIAERADTVVHENGGMLLP